MTATTGHRRLPRIFRSTRLGVPGGFNGGNGGRAGCGAIFASADLIGRQRGDIGKRSVAMASRRNAAIAERSSSESSMIGISGIWRWRGGGEAGVGGKLSPSASPDFLLRSHRRGLSYWLRMRNAMRGMLRAVLLIGALLGGCAPVQMRADTDGPAGEGYASTGDIVVRVRRTDDLPTIFGRADLFGRTRDRGFTEVRYLGLNPAGMPVFRRRDVDIMTNETTMSRTGGFSTYQAQGSAYQAGHVGGA